MRGKRKTAAAPSKLPRKKSKLRHPNLSRKSSPPPLPSSPPSSPSTRALPSPPSTTPFKSSIDTTTPASYFEAHHGPVRTSNLTLASLNVLPPSALEQALQTLSNPLKDYQDHLSTRGHQKFARASYLLATGHSLLFHGFGSKKALLDDFAQHQAQYATVIVADAFNPTVTIRALLSNLFTLLNIPANVPRKTLSAYVRAIAQRINDSSFPVTLIIHNIDGPRFRSHEAQHALCILAALPTFELVASIDHLNAPLLWDGLVYNNFAWAWIKADTFIPYQVETVYCSKILLQGGGERQVEAAIALLQSLSERARKVFTLLADRQTGGAALKECDQSAAEPRDTTFHDLFEQAKNRFLVSDQSSLQIILTELETHQLLQRKRLADASAQLCIPLQLPQLRAVLKVVEASC